MGEELTEEDLEAIDHNTVQYVNLIRGAALGDPVFDKVLTFLHLFSVFRLTLSLTIAEPATVHDRVLQWSCGGAGTRRLGETSFPREQGGVC